MTREEAHGILERFNADPGEYRSEGEDSIGPDTINGVIDAIATTNYGDGVPTDEELAQIRAALETIYL